MQIFKNIIIKSILSKIILKVASLRPLKMIKRLNIPNNKKGGLVARLLAVIGIIY